jgi:mannitol-1-phosphate 5-dehydrogenase
MADPNFKQAVQFGAGNIGRGFVGVMLARAGYTIVFVDVIESVVEQINRTKKYSVIEVDAAGEQLVTVSYIRAIDASAEAEVIAEISRTQLLTTAVGPNVLPVIAPVIAKGLQRRADLQSKTPLNIIACENLIDNSRVLEEHVMRQLPSSYLHFVSSQVGFPRCVVDKVVTAPSDPDHGGDPLTVVAEREGQLIVDRGGFVGEPPEIEGMQLTDNLDAYVEQKIFTINTGHAVAAYLGYHRGYEFIHEALQDPDIRRVVLGALVESGEVLRRRHHITPADQQAYAHRAMVRFESTSLPDPIIRVAREPKRKLAPNDRLVRPAKLALAAGTTPVHLSTGIAAALLYDAPDDPQAVELSRDLKHKGSDQVLEEICGLSPGTPLAQLVKKEMSQFLADLS